jgi:hypothetical protein
MVEGLGVFFVVNTSNTGKPAFDSASRPVSGDYSIRLRERRERNG